MFAAFRRQFRRPHYTTTVEYANGRSVFPERGAYGVGWVTLSLINSTLAGNDGGSALGTFGLSLIAGPIVTLYLAITSGSRGRL